MTTNKFTTLFSLLLMAALAAGVFGALHSQLSYSVGASYFHDLKFDQLGLSDAWQNRLGAALVGWREAWWLGLLLGVPVFGLGFLTFGRTQSLLVAGIGAIGTVILICTLAVVAGLAFGVVRLDVAMLQDFAIPDTAADPMGFARAGIMHEMLFYGALVGTVIAGWSIWKLARLEGQRRV